MKVTRKTMRMEACSLCSLVVEAGLMLSPLALTRSLNERLAPREPAFHRNNQLEVRRLRRN